MTADEDIAALRSLSAKIGSDPLLVQAAGGNTSVKSGNTLWIKASGTWLRDAVASDIFVPLDLGALRHALRDADPACEACAEFVRHDLNPSGLRPSIEASVHGLMSQKFVLHVHCVNTIAWMIRRGARQEVSALMEGLPWALVPYARPGLQLSQAISAAIRSETSVLLLQNHGLVVAAETLRDAEALLQDVTSRLRCRPQTVQAADRPALEALAPEGFRLPSLERAHGFALLPWAAPALWNNVYYPDHAVFLGQRMPLDPEPGSPVMVVPQKGVLVRSSAKPAVEAMLACLTEVFSRLGPDIDLRPLGPAEVAALLNWDAEKYRQALKHA